MTVVERYLGDHGKIMAGDTYLGKDGQRHMGRHTEEFSLRKKSILSAIIHTHYGTVKLELKAVIYNSLDKELGGRMIADSQEFGGKHLEALKSASKYINLFKKTIDSIN